MSAPISMADGAIFLSALSFGFLSGFHCMGMCGPLAVQAGHSIKGSFSYQWGRLLSYQIFGFGLYFLADTVFNISGKWAQNYLLYALVLLYFTVGILTIFNKKNVVGLHKVFSKLYQGSFRKVGQSHPFCLGFISALLPCGLLHVFLLGVIPLSHPFKVFVYILCFWLATTPFLVAVAWSFKMLKSRARLRSPVLIGIFYMLMGGYLVAVRYHGWDGGKPCHGEEGNFSFIPSKRNIDSF